MTVATGIPRPVCYSLSTVDLSTGSMGGGFAGADGPMSPMARRGGTAWASGGPSAEPLLPTGTGRSSRGRSTRSPSCQQVPVTSESVGCGWCAPSPATSPSQRSVSSRFGRSAPAGEQRCTTCAGCARNDATASMTHSRAHAVRVEAKTRLRRDLVADIGEQASPPRWRGATASGDTRRLARSSRGASAPSRGEAGSARAVRAIARIHRCSSGIWFATPALGRAGSAVGCARRRPGDAQRAVHRFRR